MQIFLTHQRWLIPTIFIALLTPFLPALDLAISENFYHPDTGKFTNNSFLEFIYQYAQAPAFIAATIAGLVFCYTYVKNGAREYRESCLLMMLVMLIGPGVLVNGVFKDHWGRPRPRQIEEFGGSSHYRPYWSPSPLNQQGDRFKSFPSGHASMGFYFLSLYVAGRRLKSNPLAYTGLALTLALGLSLGYTRVAQGGHFFSDILFAAYFSWVLSLTLDWLIFSKPYENAYKKTG